MTSKIYLDEILQSFVSDGNVFLRLGSITGDVDIAGKDIKDTSATLIIPLNRFAEFAKNVGIAADLYVSQQESVQANVQPNKKNPAEHVGLPIHVPD